MELPKIIFRRSRLYDQALAREPDWKEPKDLLKKFFVEIQESWKQSEEKILKEISKITKLTWQEKEIVCYVTYGVVPMSDPLTINPICNIHIITHELLHRILSEPENQPKFNYNWEKLMDKYKDETKTCRIHIVIHALHALIIKRLFDKKVIQDQMEWVKDPEYKKSWVIAERDGYENIVKELTQDL